MAVASAWAKPGSWALAAEEQDELPPPPPPVVPAADFPDLATAATTKVPKKKKAQSIPLGEFNTGKYVLQSSRRPASEGISDLDLPKGPRERTEEELANPRGFGAGRWGGAGGGPRGSDEPRRDREDLGPSRADEDDDWGAGKKPLERRDRMGGFGLDSSASRADDVQDWVSTKRTAPAPFPERRERVGGGFGGDSHSRADDSASWVSNKSSSVPPPPSPADGKRGGPVWGFNRDASADADSWSRRREEMSNVGGSTAGRPRLNLQKRTLPLLNRTDGDKQLDNTDGNEGTKEKGEQIPGSRSSNPFGAARPREEVLAAKGEDCREEPKVDKLEIQPRTRSSNPFGVARPREEVLAEKGEDWRKIDEKLEVMKVRERSVGWRGSRVAGEENGSAQKPDAVGAANESEEGLALVAAGDKERPRPVLDRAVSPMEASGQMIRIS